ncbi:serine-protein kinase ATM isoform X6 [Hydra vulgaris]|uniref:non-specific serine/threonine protein kinase n=1 Tax=Hydra vulgaris TaxID=6087 RepID=A0ABM4D4Y6_HYDVU
MSVVAQDLSRICLGLISEKQTERKQSANKLEVFLKEKETILLLDDTSTRKTRTDITWDLLVQRVAKYNLIEIENIKASVQLDATKRKHKEVADLYQYAIQVAEGRDLHIKANHVFNHVTNVLQKVDQSSPFVTVYSNILIKTFLTNRKHFSELTAKMWQEILMIYCKLIMEYPQATSLVQYAQVLQQLLMISPNISYIPNDFLLSFFEMVFKNIKPDRNLSFLEIVLRSFNLFCQRSMLDIRRRVCMISEKLFTVFIQMWKYQAPNIKIQLVAFFNKLLLMQKYFPSKRSCWQECLKELFGLVYQEFFYLSGRISIHSSITICEEKEMVQFAASVFSQMLVLTVDNQNVSVTYSVTSTGVARKKSKISFESPLDMLFQGLQKVPDSDSSVVWLQMLDELFKSHMSIMLKNCISNEFLSILHQNLLRCKKKEILKWLLKPLLTILYARPPDIFVESANQLILSISKTCLKVFSSDPSLLEAIDVMAFLWKNKLVGCSSDIFKLFSLNVAIPKSETLNLLKVVLESEYFPENLDLVTSSFFCTNVSSNYPLRHYLLNWLIPISDEAENLKFIEKLSSSEFPLVGFILTCLISSTPIAFCKTNKFGTSAVPYKVVHKFANEEDLLILSNEMKENKSLLDDFSYECSKDSFKYESLSNIENTVLEKLSNMVECIATCSVSENEFCRMLKLLTNVFVFLMNLGIQNKKFLKGTRMTDKVSYLQEKVMAKYIEFFEKVKDCKENLKYKCINESLIIIKNFIYSYLDDIGYLLENLPGAMVNLLLHNTEKCLTEPMYQVFESIDSEINNKKNNKFSNNPDHNLLKRDCLSETEQIQLTSCEAVMFLLMESKSFIKEKERFYNFFIEIKDVSYVELQMLIFCNEFMVKYNIKLQPEFILSLVLLSRTFLSVYRFDQDVCSAILSGLVYYIQQIQDFNDSLFNEARVTIVQILSVFWLVRKEKCCPELRTNICNALRSIIMVNNSEMWKMNFDQSENNQDFLNLPSYLLIQLLTDENTFVRVHAAKSLNVLFLNKSAAEKEKNFSLLLETLESLILFNNQGVPNKEIKINKEDEVFNRRAVVILSLSEVILCDNYLDKNALLSLLNYVEGGFLKPKKVFKALESVSTKLHYKTILAYIKPRIGFILFHFLERNCFINNFPSTCFGMSFDEFIKKNYKVIVAYLVLKNDYKSIESLHQYIDNKQLLVDSFTLITSFVLPGYVEHLTNVKSSDSINVMEQFTNCITVEVFNNEVVKNFREIMVELFLRVYDSPGANMCTSKFTRVGDPCFFYPTFSSNAVKMVISYMASCYGTKKEPISIFLKLPASVLSILVSIALHAMKSKEELNKLSCIRSYYCFAYFLLENLKDLEEVCGKSLVRELLYRSLTFVEFSNERISIIGLKILKMLCKCMEKHLFVSKEIALHMQLLVNKLQYFSSDLCIPKAKFALKLLHYLLLDCNDDLRNNNDDLRNNNDDLRNAFLSLDRFSDLQQFYILNNKLIDIKSHVDRLDIHHDFRRMIKTLKDFSYINPDQTLSNLKTYLDKNVSSLTQDGNLLVLVDCLKEICISGSTASQILAVDCLGSVGPGILSPLMQSVEQDEGCMHNDELKSIMLENPFVVQLHIILKEIVNSCIDNSVKIAHIAYTCLERVLQAEEIKDLLKLFRKCFFLSYMTPFIMKKNKYLLLRPKIAPISLDLLHMSLQKLKIYSNETCDSWIKRLITLLLSSGIVKNNIFTDILPLCQQKTRFAKLVLPYIVHNILIADEAYRLVFSKVFSSWVTDFISMNDSYKHLNEAKDKMMELISLTTYLRCLDVPFVIGRPVTSWDNNFWMDFNYFELSQAALRCSEYFTAALFMEIWADDLRKLFSLDTQANTSEESNFSSQDFHIQGLTGFSNDVLDGSCQKLLYEIYTNIGDVDAVYGVGAGSISLPHTRIQTYQHEQEFNKALLTSDLLSMHTRQSMSSNNLNIVLENLMNSGLHHISTVYMKGLSQIDAAKFEEIKFEIAWRNSIWDINEISCDMTDNLGFNGNLYQSLRYLNCGDIDAFHFHLNNAKLNVVHKVPKSRQASKSLYNFLSKCFTLNMLEKASSFLESNVSNSFLNCCELRNDFKYYEPAFVASVSVLKIGCVHENVLDATEQNLRHLCKIARESKRFEISEKCIQQFREFEKIGKVSLNWKLEEAKLYWARGETSHAIHVLKTLINYYKKVESESAASLYPVALSLYGHWLGETRSQNSVQIMEKYLEPAIAIMERKDYNGIYTPIDAYHSLAKYADVQYEALFEYTKSQDFEIKQSVIRKNRVELSTIPKKINDQQLKHHSTNIEKQLNIDETERDQVYNDKKRFLQKAIHNYCRCLQCGDKYDLKVLRLCSLWFENFDDEVINIELKESMVHLPSKKFLLVMYQLAARLGTSMTQQCDAFNNNLQKIIEQCVMDHPHHTLFILFALCNADIEERMNSRDIKRSKKLSTSEQDVQDKSRIQAAQNVLNRLKCSSPKIIQDTERLVMAYIELAYWDISHLKNQKGQFQLPEAKLIRKISNLETISCPTIALEIDPSCKYEKIIYITKFDGQFTHAGGINLPKIVSCIGSDGKTRRQLVKGKDDLRQDAVMQQVFGVVNLLLKNDLKCKRRNLSVRTYKVVPLSRKSGVMEWCEGTIPLGEYLLCGRNGNAGAHKRYYPNDWSYLDCRTKLVEATVHDGKNSKLNVFLKILQHFHPVFRHFFTENFKDPAVWFERRMSYTKSVAVCSIVGYIVGLGDRHCQNILIDCNTAEIVHIDLGIAFEQGRLLPTPERVPFRLTRDIVDGMGIIGIEGVFRRCCEETLLLMRESRDAIITIIEVLLYDPLSTWTVTTSKAVQIQAKCSDLLEAEDGRTVFDNDNRGKASDIEKNKMAERVLLRLKQKLSGMEGGGFLSIQGHVNYLIQEAQSTENLCKLFPGWQPWL